MCVWEEVCTCVYEEGCAHVCMGGGVPMCLWGVCAHMCVWEGVRTCLQMPVVARGGQLVSNCSPHFVAIKIYFLCI